MFFSEILDIHKRHCVDGSLLDLLGDGFLLETNPVYRNVRKFSEKIGCRYVEAYPDYLLLPFLELPRIVESKQVPYVPSARLMGAVEQSRPGIFTTNDMPIPESYHLHESAHVIAEHFLKDIVLDRPEEEILKVILAESFANTVDALACTAAVNDIHIFFIKQNCYMHPRKKLIQAMNSLSKSLGPRFTFMLTLFTYIHANFLTKPLSKKSVQEIANQYAPAKKISVKLQADIQTICAIGEKLDPRFRLMTTANYLKQRGYEGEIYDLLDFPFMKRFAANPGFKSASESLCRCIL